MQRKLLYGGVAGPASFDASMQRPRIRALMREAVVRPLTAVVANVGYGKTQAVATLYEANTDRIIWMQLTRLDNLTSRFWNRLGYAVERYNPSLAEELSALSFPETNATLHGCLALIARALMQSNARYVLVLDDIHVIENQQLLSALEEAAMAQIPRFSIVVTSQEKPRLNLTAIQEKGLLSLVTQEDLRLTCEEIAQYYERQGIKIDMDTAKRVSERTEGWFFLVYLAGLSIKDGTFRDMLPVEAGVLDIFTLIEYEIYRPMPKDVQRFFLKLAILDSASADLLRLMADKKPDLIGEALRWNGILFGVNPSTGRYHIMKLFGEFLLKRHNDLTEAETAEINRIAGTWCAENGSKIEALNYLKAGGAYGQVFEIILEHSARCPAELADLFIETIDLAPESAIAQRPVVLVARVKFLLNNNRVPEAEEALRSLCERFEAMPDSPERRAALGEAYLLQGILSMVFKTLDFAAHFARAEALLPGGSVIFDEKMALAYGASYFSASLLAPGSVKRQVETFYAAMPGAVRMMHGCGAGLDYVIAAQADYAVGNLAGAENSAYAAIYNAQAWRQFDIECMAHAVMLSVLTMNGDYRRAGVTLEALRKCADYPASPDAALLCDVAESEYYARLGLTDKISRWILDGSDVATQLAPISIDRGQRVRAQCYLIEGRYAELLGLLSHLDNLHRAANALMLLIEDALLRAIACYYMEERAQAFEALTRAYALASENQIIMPFVERGKWMRTLANAAKLDAGCAIPDDWLNMIATKASTYAKRVTLIANAQGAQANGDEIKLSKREIQVLSGLCHGLTREQIAESHGISVNTVKGMMPILFNKLGAINSLDAVRIATSRKLVS